MDFSAGSCSGPYSHCLVLWSNSHVAELPRFLTILLMVVLYFLTLKTTIADMRGRRLLNGGSRVGSRAKLRRIILCPVQNTCL